MIYSPKTYRSFANESCREDSLQLRSSGKASKTATSGHAFPEAFPEPPWRRLFPEGFPTGFPGRLPSRRPPEMHPGRV